MADSSTSRSLQDFSLIRSYVEKRVEEFNMYEPSLGFMFFALELILNLQEDEVKDAITDNHYLKKSSTGEEGRGGHDRGIDAVYIDDSEVPTTVHFFNFKYTSKFEKTDNHFPSNEIDKISAFLNSLMQKDKHLENDINPILFSKIEDIWNLFESQNPNFVIHVCANFYNGFQTDEKKRLEREVNKYSNLTVEYHLMPWFVSKLTKAGKRTVNARIRAIDKNLYEKSDGDIRALIVNIDARDLLRIVVNDEATREKVDLQDFSILQNYDILEDSFEDNVRLYLKQRSKINRNILSTGQKLNTEAKVRMLEGQVFKEKSKMVEPMPKEGLFSA